MSCEGCIYGNSKEAGCNFTYACNTTGRQVQKQVQKEDSSKKKGKRAAKKSLVSLSPEGE